MEPVFNERTKDHEFLFELVNFPMKSKLMNQGISPVYCYVAAVLYFGQTVFEHRLKYTTFTGVLLGFG
jgi:hypothetical protein